MLALGITAAPARSRAGGLLRTARLDDPDHGRRRTGPRALTRPRRTTAGPAGTGAQPAARCFPVRKTVTAVAPADGASLEPGSALEPSCSAAQVRGPGPAGPDGTDQANQAGGPVQKSTGPRGPGERTAPRRAAVTAPAGDVNAAAVAAYRASLQKGRPLSERKLAAAFGRTSRRWARARMAEARPGPAAG